MIKTQKIIKKFVVYLIRFIIIILSLLAAIVFIILSVLLYRGHMYNTNKVIYDPSENKIVSTNVTIKNVFITAYDTKIKNDILYTKIISPKKETGLKYFIKMDQDWKRLYYLENYQKFDSLIYDSIVHPDTYYEFDITLRWDASTHPFCFETDSLSNISVVECVSKK